MKVFIKKIILNNSHFIKFCIVGTFGLITNLIIFYISVNYFKLSINLSAIFAFIFANFQNYIFNSMWTFIKSNHEISIKKYIKFLSSYLIGLAVNLTILNLFVTSFGDDFKFYGQIFGVIGGTILNFKLSKYFVFRIKN